SGAACSGSTNRPRCIACILSTGCRGGNFSSIVLWKVAPRMANDRSGVTRTHSRVRGSGVQTVYERLRQSIIDLALPPGSPLDEVSLSAQFQMSRTPIREALVRLAAE